MTGRKPRKDELDLWRTVTRDVERQLPEIVDRPVTLPPSSKTDLRPRDPLPLPTMDGGKTPLKNDIAPSLGASLAAQGVAMDTKVFRQLKRGKLKPESRIDLHGMTADRAHGALNRFVLDAHSQGKRLLLVITGKGKHRDEGGPIPTRFGVLRHQVPQWLRLPPLGPLVLQVTEAHVSHGGGGAYYVYLRRGRSAR